MSVQMDNLFARDGFWWWVGVVEDRMDPLKLGRVRVRITGYHINNKQELPTDDLPWAMPMQPIVSAAISGKGETPLGPLEGTWVVGFFADGSDCQQPIIMGTIGGIPGQSEICAQGTKNAANQQNAVRDTNGNIVLDQNGSAIPVTPVPVPITATSSGAITSTLPPLDENDLQNILNSLGFSESSSIPGGAQNYATVSSSNYLGKYQMSAVALQTIGYLKSPVPHRELRNTEAYLDKNWTGKDNINNVNEFLQNKNNIQEKAAFQLLKSNYEILKSKGVIDAATTPRDVAAGYLESSWFGWTYAKALKDGIDKVDGNGTRASEYYTRGVRAVNGTAAIPVAAAQGSSVVSGLNNNSRTNWAGALNNPKLGQPAAYADPNSVYPKCDYTARPDTNKLATNNDNLTTTLLSKKESARSTSIPTANGASSGSWSEPPSAFNAKYPYNHVKETESGHVIELDDTPNAERIHIYHRTGTYVEIDREGSVRYKVMGENYEIFNRNNRMYITGNHDVTVDGAKTLLVKNALDVEVLGKTTINIKNDADVNISGTLNLKAQNINIEAQQDINMIAGNYMNVQTGGDLNYRVFGEEQHRVFGDFDLDASTVNINSGTAFPMTPTSTNLGNGVLSSIYGSAQDAFEATGLSPLPTDIANPQNAISKGLSGIFKSLGKGLSGIFAGLPSAGADNSLNGGAVLLGGSGFVATASGSGLNLSDLFKNSNPISGNLTGILNGLPGAGSGNILNAGAVVLGGLGGNVSNAVGGFNLSDILSKLPNAAGENSLGAGAALLGGLGGGAGALVSTGSSLSNILPKDLLDRGTNLVKSFVAGQVSKFDIAQPAKLLAGTAVLNEFKSWSDFPAATKLSQYFNLGDLSSRVQEVSLQHNLIAQGGLTKDLIATNLKALAVNALDPFKERYPNLVVSNAFMPTIAKLAGTDPDNPISKLVSEFKAAAGTASSALDREFNTANEFNLGQAASLQFKGLTADKYYEVAQWARDNLPYDQIRLEYSTLGDTMPWITVVHKQEGNRPIETGDKIVTTMNGQVVANYLVDMTTAV